MYNLMVIIDIHLHLIVPDIVQDVKLLWRDVICLHVINVSLHCICIFICLNHFLISHGSQKRRCVLTKNWYRNTCEKFCHSLNNIFRIPHTQGFQLVIGRFVVDLFGQTPLIVYLYLINLLFNSFWVCSLTHLSISINNYYMSIIVIMCLCIYLYLALEG